MARRCNAPSGTSRTTTSTGGRGHDILRFWLGYKEVEAHDTFLNGAWKRFRWKTWSVCVVFMAIALVLLAQTWASTTAATKLL